jgi:hypothetical protein
MSSSIPEVERVTPPHGTLTGVRVWIGAIFIVGGLGLIVCGGAFLMGAMCLVHPQLLNPGVPADPLSPQAGNLLDVLYVLAGACLLGAVALFVLAVRGLLQISAMKWEPS